MQQLPASPVKVLKRPEDKTFIRKNISKKVPWEINMDPNAELSPQIQLKLEPEIELEERDEYQGRDSMRY